MKKIYLLLLLIIPSFLGAQTVVDVVVDSPDHETLEAAVIAAELAGTLSGDGPFTLFAPTDSAFSALPAGTIDTLLADPTGVLSDILLYHAISGDIRSTDLMDGQIAMTINGKNVTVTIDSTGVFINDAQVTVADVVASNGVVHVIDAVLLPPALTVVDVVVNSPDHETLEAAVIAAELAGTLSGDGPFTLFAPTDAAFAALPAGTVDTLLADPTGALTDILLYHAIAGDIRSTDLMDGQTATTINGEDVTVTIDATGVFINDAQVTVADIVTDNGVVHVIDAVLIPPSTTSVQESSLSSVVEIFPNPATDFFSYSQEVTSNMPLQHIRLIDLSGRVLIDYKVTSNRFDLSGISEGFYIVEMRFDDGYIHKKLEVH